LCVGSGAGGRRVGGGRRVLGRRRSSGDGQTPTRVYIGAISDQPPPPQRVHGTLGAETAPLRGESNTSSFGAEIGIHERMERRRGGEREEVFLLVLAAMVTSQSRPRLRRRLSWRPRQQRSLARWKDLVRWKGMGNRSSMLQATRRRPLDRPSRSRKRRLGRRRRAWTGPGRGGSLRWPEKGSCCRAGALDNTGEKWSVDSCQAGHRVSPTCSRK
jgi:hypothetical protein